jgi:3-oxoacyl-(acyl-carrier-protein) synthase
VKHVSFASFQVNYINAHATSTLAGDLAEINAIKKVFKNTSGIKINATKVLLRHLFLFAVENFLFYKS